MGTCDEPRIRVAGEVLFREVGDEAVLLQTATGQYYGLDPVGTRMWHLLAEGGGVESACGRLLTEFEVDEKRLRRDMQRLVDELLSHRLIEVEGER